MSKKRHVKSNFSLSRMKNPNRKPHEPKVYKLRCELRNIRMNDFVKSNDSYLLSKKIGYGSLFGRIKVCCDSTKPLQDILLENHSENFKIYCDEEKVTIKISVPVSNIEKNSYKWNGQIGAVSCEFTLSGNLKQMLPKQKKHHKKRKKGYSYVSSSWPSASSSAQRPIASSVVWAASHPFQGGGCSPK